MFTQQTNLPLSPTIKIYLRLKDKKSFLLSLKEPILLSELKDLIHRKTKIPQHDLIVMYQGKPIHFSHGSEAISIKDKSILHIINRKNIRNDIIEISIKFILRNEEKACLGETKLFAKSEQLVKDFIHSKVVRVIEERTEQKIEEKDLNLVSNGVVLKKNLNFHNYLIEEGSEIICMINNSENLQKAVNNISTHKIFTSHRQRSDHETKTGEKFEIDPKSFSQQLLPTKKISEISKKPSLPLSQKKSQEFIKFQTFDSKFSLTEQERLLNEAQSNQKNTKLKKKQKIASDLARKFENQLSVQNEIQNQGIQNENEENLLQDLPEPEVQFESQPKYQESQPKQSNKFEKGAKINEFEQTENQQVTKKFDRSNKPKCEVFGLDRKNATVNQSKEPDSPIEVEYPPIQRQGVSLAQWDPTSVSESITVKFNGQNFPESLPQISNQNGGLNFEKNQDMKSQKVDQSQKPLFVGKNDFLMYGSFEKDKSSTDMMGEICHKFTDLIKQRQTVSQNLSISVEQSKIKTTDLKMGDYLVFGSLQSTSKQFINEQLIYKFEDLINKINQKRVQQYGSRTGKIKQEQTQGNPEIENSNQKSQEALGKQSKVQNI